MLSLDAVNETLSLEGRGDGGVETEVYHQKLIRL
jgi:hypothetical protein